MPGPMSSPVAMGGLGQNDQQLLSMGAQALLDGKVSQSEVQDAAKTLHSDPSWLSDHLDKTGGKASNPYVFTPPGGGVAAGGRPTSKNEKKNSTTTKTDTTYDPEQWSKMLSMVRESPEVQDQKQGIADQTDLLKMQMANQAPNSDYWVKPLTSLADATTGSNMSANYKGQPTQADRNKANLGSMDELQKRKADLSKTILEGVGKLKSGSTTDMSQLASMMGLNLGMGANQNSREQLAAQRTMNNDPILKTYVPRLDGAMKILNLMQGARDGGFKSTAPVLAQLNAEIARLETGSQSPGLAASEKTEMGDTAAKYQNIVDTLSGDVTGVDMEKKFQQAEGMVKDLGRSYQGHIHDRTEFLKAGALPSQEDTFGAKQKQLESAYAGKFDLPAKAPSNNKGSDKYPPGRPNAKWTPAQLNAYMADNG